MKLAEGVTAEQFYDRIRETYEGNNHVHRMEVMFYAGSEQLRMVFETPEGFEPDQKTRRGTIELLID